MITTLIGASAIGLICGYNIPRPYSYVVATISGSIFGFIATSIGAP